MSADKFRLLLIEDNEGRRTKVKSWLPENIILVEASSGGRALGILERDRGHIYGGIMLDFDLNENPVTTADLKTNGGDVVRAIVKYTSIDTPILIHSMNFRHATSLYSTLEDAGFYAKRIPFRSMNKTNFKEWLDDSIDLWEYVNKQ